MPWDTIPDTGDGRAAGKGRNQFREIRCASSFVPAAGQLSIGANAVAIRGYDAVTFVWRAYAVHHTRAHIVFGYYSTKIRISK